MLDDQEQRLWDDLERNYHARHHGGRRVLPAPIVGGVWAAIFLVLFDVFAAAMAVGAVTVLMWLLWRFLPQVDAERLPPESTHDQPAPVAEQPALLWHQPEGDVRRR